MQSPKISIAGIVFQNKQAERYYAKYYPQHSSLDKGSFNLTKLEGQKKFQKGLLDKVERMNVVSKLNPDQNQIFSFGDFTILFKVINELLIFLICDEEQNYFVMESVINCIGGVLQLVTKDNWTGKAIYDNLDSIILVADEIIDEGLIVHLDRNIIFDRIKMKDSTGADPNKKVQTKPAPPTQVTGAVGNAFSSIFGFAKSSLQKTLNLG